ncbi:lambda-exonuclease family protein [uncultured Dialister sp.]|uniref:YqaJ viral recombinase family nuclease n=1 Tax=uncultured Dialister sp. TaxID=278064 RepID=UPI0027DC1C8C|nr:YqaJ viral recombinase family protein [uncultured Dialister sp.]
MAYRGCDLILSCHEAETDHEKWLATRNAGIGGSDASVIVGLNPYKSPYQLWLEKTGQAEAPDLSGNQYIYWGHKNEANIADWFEEDSGKKVRKLGTLRNRAHPFMLANVDRAVMGEEAGLEIKTAGVSQAKRWKGDEIPDAYYCQCLHYLAVTGADRWYIAVLIGGNEAIRKTVERNEEDIKALIEAEKEFWDRVVTRTPPPVDGSASCSAALSERFKGGGPSILLPGRVDSMIESLNDDKKIMEALKRQITEKENAIKELLGDAEEGTTDHYRVQWKTMAGRESAPLGRIKKKAPDIYQLLSDKGFITAGKPVRRFSIKENDD